MNKNSIPVGNIALSLIIIIVTVAITLTIVCISKDYNIISNEELNNITQNAYFQGALYTSQTGYIINNETGSLLISPIEAVCNNLNKQEAQQ